MSGNPHLGPPLRSLAKFPSARVRDPRTRPPTSGGSDRVDILGTTIFPRDSHVLAGRHTHAHPSATTLPAREALKLMSEERERFHKTSYRYRESRSGQGYVRATGTGARFKPRRSASSLHGREPRAPAAPSATQARRHPAAGLRLREPFAGQPDWSASPRRVPGVSAPRMRMGGTVLRRFPLAIGTPSRGWGVPPRQNPEPGAAMATKLLVSAGFGGVGVAILTMAFVGYPRVSRSLGEGCVRDALA